MSDFRTEWFLGNLDELPTLDEVMRARKKGPKRMGDDGDLEKTIPELFRAIEELKSSRLVSQAILDRARKLAESWHPEFGNSNLLIVLLAGLVTAQHRKIERLDKLRQLFSGPPAERKLSAKQRYERGRSYVPVVGKIEWEFGGVCSTWYERHERQDDELPQTARAAYMS